MCKAEITGTTIQNTLLGLQAQYLKCQPLSADGMTMAVRSWLESGRDTCWYWAKQLSLQADLQNLCLESCAAGSNTLIQMSAPPHT